MTTLDEREGESTLTRSRRGRQHGGSAAWQGRQPEQPPQARAAGAPTRAAAASLRNKKADPGNRPGRHNHSQLLRTYAFSAAFTATAQATVAPTMGLLPMPMRPIMSTCAGTELEPANCASECMRPMVSVMP